MSRNVFIDLIGRDRVSPAFASAAASAERAAGKMSAVNAKMAKTGAALTKGITVPLVAIAAVSTKTAIDFQKSMTLLQTAGGESAKKVAVISKGIQDVAVKTGTSLKDLTEGMYTVAKAGSQKWSAAGQLLVLKAAAEGAKAENVDLATATNALTSVMMSYHLGADQAVKVQNELVVGAGRAKTTMQAYAASLSTVVPIASAAHISFAQVAGAIATMTQHGTSADEATQELSHTIRNLLSPNQVAQKAMQQLGLSVTDVTKNLGKRGLTGTIDLITNAIAKHMGPAGMVAVKAFKESQSAAGDLNTMLSKMPKNLAGISQGLLSGKTSIKDYTKDAKDLGGQSGAMALQFLSLYKSSNGFNDLLKSGQPGVRTFAGTLKNVLGTATSMNTALQLGGENATYFATTTKDVNMAAAKAGADVMGWAKTQDTLAVKMDKAKASLQVLGLEIGNALIPVVTKMVGWVSKAVDWFEHLSGSDKKILAWSLGVLAALGPVLTITARLGTVASGIGRFAGGIGTMLGRMAGATEATQLRMATAMRGVGSAIAGVGIGLAVSQFTKNASTTTQWLGVLGSTAAGAAIGFSMGGPIGAALGGLAGGLTSLATTFMSTGKSASDASKMAQDALATQNSSALSLLDTLKQVNGAYGTQLRVATTTELQKARVKVGGQDQGNVLNAAGRIGIDPKTVVDATLGSQQAIASVQAAMARYKKSITASGSVWQGSAEQAYLTALSKQLGAVSAGAGDGEQAWEQYQRGVSGATLASMGLAKALAGTGTNLVGQSFDATRNRNAISAVAKANQDAAIKQAAHAKSVQSVISWLAGADGALKVTTNNLGFNSAAVQKLIDQYKLTPAQIVTRMTADIKPGAAGARTMQSIIDAIRQHKIPGLTANSGPGKGIIADLQTRLDSMYQHYVPPITVNTDPAIAKLSALFASIPSTVAFYVNPIIDAAKHAASMRGATGGTVTGGIPGRDSVHVLAMPGEEIIRTSQARKHRSLLKAINNGVQGFAAGGTVGTPNTKIPAVIGDIHSFMGALGSGSSAASALTSLFHDAAAAGAAASAIARQRTEETRLLAVETARQKVMSALATAQQKLATVTAAYWQSYHSAADASMGTFDVSTAGQVYSDRAATPTSILAALTTAAANAGKFSAVLKTLVKEGVPKFMIAQLAAAGPAALAQAQALASATPAQILKLSSTAGQLVSASQSIGSIVSGDMYGAGVASAQGLVQGLASRQSALNTAVRNIALSMVATLKKTLGIHSPSRLTFGIGVQTGEGYRLGLVDRLESVRQTSKDLANAGTPGSQAAAWGAATDGQGRPIEIHVHEVQEPRAAATAALRRLRAAGYGSA